MSRIKDIVVSQSEGKRIYFRVDGEPVSKGRPRMTRDGRAYTPARTHKAEAFVRSCYEKKYGHFQFPEDVPLELRAIFYLRIPKTRYDLVDGQYCTKHIDTDNLLKLVSDALNGAAYDDDSQIVKINAEKRWSHDPHTEIEVIDISE